MRDLGRGTRLGVIWYLTRNGLGNVNDGKHAAYLDEPAKYRHFDPDLFDLLRDVRSKDLSLRSVCLVEESGLFGDARFFSEIVPPLPRRAEWFNSAARHVADADVLFLDPDNGLETRAPNEKHVLWSELIALLRADRQRTLVVYQHQNRTKVELGANFPDRHLAECAHRFPALRTPLGLCSRRGTVRAFLLLPHEKHEEAVHRVLDGVVTRWAAGNKRTRLYETRIARAGGVEPGRGADPIVRTKRADGTNTKAEKERSMARMTVCKLSGREIGIDEALALRDKKGERGFRCIGCGGPVVAHAGGADGKRHFEHHPKNERCVAR
jgi:hypothetical protein